MKTRTITRKQLVPHTVDGTTHLVLDEFPVDVPVPPRDWDRIILNAVTAAAALIATACIVWSTASIGDLLAQATIAPAAYAAAAVFDLVWLGCMALEWLARYDHARAAFPRRAGYVALAVAMAAIAAHGAIADQLAIGLVGAAVSAHGAIADQLAIGLVGAAVSALAKTMWTAVLRHHAKPLDRRTQQWVDAERAKAGGSLAMVAVRRELTRAEALITAERAALSGHSGDDPETAPEDPEETPKAPEPHVSPPLSGPMTITDAVRTALSAGISDPDAVLRYVRKVADANAKEESVARTLRMIRSAS
ncbi:protein transporter Sec31 [Streptomyces sp. SAS_281]|uniref:protein transporter Sec31 n=1 Tax=Streptomyces sp. SAS_281 TaxID=3412744 RepID=UPI00403D2AED